MVSLVRSSDSAWVATVGFFIFWAATVFLAGQWLDWLPARSSEVSVGPPLERVEASPTVTITGFQFLHVPAASESWPVWVLYSDGAEIYEQRHEALMSNLSVNFSPEQGVTAAVLRGRQGRLNLDSMDFTVDGVTRPLTIDWQGQYHLETATLTWKNSEQVMETSAAVSIEGEGLHVTGTGLRWSLPEGTVSVLENVTATVGATP